MLRFGRFSFKTWWVFGLLSAIALVAVLSLHRSTQASTTSLSTAVRRCLPAGVSFERLAETNQGNATYYLIGLNGGDQSRREETDSLIVVKNNQCEPIVRAPLTPLSSVVQIGVAKQLELQRYRTWIRSYGKENFQRALDTTPLVQPLAPEVEWALQQLGLRVPHVKS